LVKFKEKIRSDIFELLKLVHKSEDAQPSKDTEMHTRRDGKLFSFKTGYASGLNELIDYIFKTKPLVQTNLSKGFIEHKIYELIIELLESPPDSRTKKVDLFSEGLSKINVKSYVIPVPVLGLSGFASLKIGQTYLVEYKNLKKHLMEKHSVKKECFFDSAISEEFDFKGTYAVCTINASEVEKAKELAVKETNSLLNIFRLYFYPTKFAVIGKTPRLEDFNIHSFCTTDNSNSSSFERGDTIQLYSVNEAQLEKIKPIGFSNIKQILEKSKITSLEASLLNSINWFGRISPNDDLEENVIRLITAFETLFFENHYERGTALAETVAMVTHKDPEYRFRVFELITELNTLRNKIIHSGYAHVRGFRFFWALMILRLVIIQVAIHINEYPKKEDWAKLIRKSKFSEKIDYQ